MIARSVALALSPNAPSQLWTYRLTADTWLWVAQILPSAYGTPLRCWCVVLFGISFAGDVILIELAMQPLRMVRAAHDFPATALRFSPSSQTVVSTSADSTLRVVPVAKTWAGAFGSSLAH